MSETEDTALQPAENPLEDVPPLVTKPATTEDDKVEALKLIADSVAQQRQFASKAVLSHPLTLAAAVVLLAISYQSIYKGKFQDMAIVGTTFAGALMGALITVRYVTRGYIDEAEAVGTWKWLDKGRDEVDAVGKEDEILLSRYGGEPIGGLVLRGVREVQNSSGNASPKKRRQGSSNKNATVTGQIRGFTTIYRYRRKGVGTELLEEAIKICQEKGWSGPEFATDHANSRRILWRTFNGSFDRREKETRKLLEKVKESMGVTGGKKGRR